MLNKQNKESKMNDINETMDNAIIEDDFNKIENIALNPKNAYVKCHDLNIWTGKSSYTHRWVDVSNVGKDFWDDLNSDCQDYVMSLDKYKDLDYDSIVGLYDEPIEKKNNESLQHLKDQINKKK